MRTSACQHVDPQRASSIMIAALTPSSISSSTWFSCKFAAANLAAEAVVISHANDHFYFSMLHLIITIITDRTRLQAHQVSNSNSSNGAASPSAVSLGFVDTTTKGTL